MADADFETSVIEEAEPLEPSESDKSRWLANLASLLARHRLESGAASFLAGIALIVVALGVLTDVSSFVRGLMSLVGIVIGFWGLDKIAKIVWGDSFETGLWLAMLWIFVVVVAAVFADFLPLSESRDAAKTIIEGTPTLKRPDIFSAHPFGTDRQALDILGGTIYGARVSLQVSLLATGIGIAIGGIIGVAAGFFRRKTDATIGILTDTVLAFPPLILLLALAAVLDRNPINMALSLAVVGVPTYIRLSRANTLVFAQRDFVLAARAMGAGRRRIIFRELVPNVTLPLFSYAFIIIAVLIVAEASLSFLGLGIQRPEPSWGNMIAAGQDAYQDHPHLVFIPGAIMFLTVFSLNRIGEKARKLWDPTASKI